MKIWKTTSGYIIIKLLSGRSNVFLLSNGDKNIIIDTSPEGKWKKLNKRIKKLNINQIDYLILTHTHFDHAGNSARLKKAYNAKIFVHKSEASNLTKGENPEISGTNSFTNLMVKLFGKMTLKFHRYEPCTFDFLVDTKYNLNEIGFNAYILHTPGHTEGSMSLIIDNEIAIVGDTMIGIFKKSVYPPFAQDPKELVKSWEILLKTDCNLFLPAHGNKKQREQLLNNYNKRI